MTTQYQPSLAGPVDLRLKNEPVVSESRQGSRTFAVGSIIVNATPEKIWKILTDYEKAPLVFANLQKCEVIKDDGRSKLVRQLVRPKGTPFKLDYVVEIKETAPNLMEWHRTSGALREVAGSWRLEQEPNNANNGNSHTVGAGTGNGNGVTKVTYSIYLDGGLLLPAWLLRGQSKNYLPELLLSIKRASEQKTETAQNRAEHAST